MPYLHSGAILIRIDFIIVLYCYSTILCRRVVDVNSPQLLGNSYE